MTASIERPAIQLIPNGIATVEVSYYMPDHPLLIAPPFIWQSPDLYPKYPRVLRLIEFWRNNIDAVIEQIRVTHELSKGTWKIGPDELPPQVH